MSDEPTQIREICLTRLFPWIRLVKAVGVSIDPKKLFLAALGLVALNTGWSLLNQAFPNTDPRIPASSTAYTFSADDRQDGIGLDLGLALGHLAEPAQCLVRPFVTFFSGQLNALSLVHAFLVAAWAVAVWGIFGGAIARIATLQVTIGERIGMRKALEFALSKSIPLICGPLSPLLGIALLAIPCALFGLLYRLPTTTNGIGSTLAGVLLVLPLLAGLVMALILVGLAAGWPLMHASVAAEAEDGFDALSRSYAYVFQRPIRYGGYLLLAWLFGVLGIIFVSLFANLVIHMAQWSLGFAAPADSLAAFSQLKTSSLAVESTAAKAHSFWISVVKVLAHGWIYSYFWTAASLIYLTIRQDVDGTDWRQVSIPLPPPHPLMPAAEETITPNEPSAEPGEQS